MDNQTGQQKCDHYHGYELLNLLMKHNIPFSEGNIIKYLWRWKEKGGIADLLKAKDYLDRLITYQQEKKISTTYKVSGIPYPVSKESIK